MTLTRRRFLTISAACLAAAPGHAATARWQGQAMGAEVSITLKGPEAVTAPALVEARAMLHRIEAEFSLYDAGSALSRLNRTGRLDRPSPLFLDLMEASDGVHRATGGLFDPTVQPLWQAIATGRDPDAVRAAVGWDRVHFDPGAVTLGPGQALTFNGIAQGFATDCIARLLDARGLGDTLVNMGEFRGRGGPWRIGLADPTFGLMGTRSLRNGAIATSSPAAMLSDRGGHILHPGHAAQWSTVSVEAEDATTADGFSTAFCLSPIGVIRGAAGRHGIRRITLIDTAGDLTTL
ncbi:MULTISPECIES: FAD:protein FMN transferase [unclassified Sulfitobacter]|uniref:FAD:protein FMN transferase n=3 Tax=Sulfitobacter TaxID=60136 RepID=UPI0007C2BD3B|nr:MULTISPECIES: FAD:protein FMN transferase [unclassified Sulfitobacter]KZY02683.1 nosX [Sulfitobacter sp. HI0023]KZY25883.1 nosX [Sulfitobacter sp. HI0040]